MQENEMTKVNPLQHQNHNNPHQNQDREPPTLNDEEMTMEDLVTAALADEFLRQNPGLLLHGTSSRSKPIPQWFLEASEDI